MDPASVPQPEIIRCQRSVSFLLLLVAGASIIIPRFFFDVRADNPAGFLFFFALASSFLVASWWLRKNWQGDAPWRTAYAIFVFSLATPMAANELGRTTGSWFVTEASGPESNLLVRHFFSTLLPALVIYGLMRVSGRGSDSLYLQRGNLRLSLTIGLVGFISLLAATLFGAEMFVGREISIQELSQIAPWMLTGVLLNGFREELWFRGNFMRPFSRLLGPGLANILQALLFALPHFTVDYIQQPTGFVLITFLGGLLFGYLTLRTESFLAPVLLHAGFDIPIWLGVFVGL